MVILIVVVVEVVMVVVVAVVLVSLFVEIDIYHETWSTSLCGETIYLEY